MDSKVLFEPRSIELHMVEYSVVGYAPTRFMEMRQPVLSGTLRTSSGGLGSVEVPLTEGEIQSLNTIVHAACERAERLVVASLNLTER